MAAVVGKKRKREPSAAEAVAFAQDVARNPIAPTDDMGSLKAKVLEIQQVSMPEDTSAAAKRRKTGFDDSKAAKVDRRICSPLLFQDAKRRPQPFVLATKPPGMRDHSGRIDADHARISSLADRDLQKIHDDVKHGRMVPLVQALSASGSAASLASSTSAGGAPRQPASPAASSSSSSAATGAAQLLAGGRPALTSPGTRGTAGGGIPLEPLPTGGAGAGLNTALLSPGKENGPAAPGGGGATAGAAPPGRLDRFDPRVGSKEARRRARQGLTLAQDLRADAVEQRAQALEGELIELPRAKELSRLDSYLDFVSRTYYGTPEAGDAADEFSAVRRSTLGRLKSHLRVSDVLDKWTPYEVAVFESSMCVMGKQPHVVASVIGTKTTQEVMEFFYLWKKSKNYAKWKQTFKPPGHQEVE